jgi:hypothetical protein
MATTPTPTPAPTNWFTKDWIWITQHIIILVLAAALVFGGVYEIDAMIARHDASTEQHYSQLLIQQTALTKSIEDKFDASTAQHALEAQQYQAQIAADQAAMKQRDDLLKLAIAKIGTMTPVQIQADLQPKLRQGQATVLADGIKLDTEAARDVDAQITEGANAKADLATTQTALTKETTIAANATADLQTAKTAIAAEQKKNDDQVVACNAAIAVEKANARKGKLKWFGIGYIAGFLSGLAAHLA